MRRVVIIGAAGRDFHNFNVVFRHHPEFQVVAFTANQIPDIAGRVYPAVLAGEDLYPRGIPIVEEKELEKLIREKNVDVCVFSYSDVNHQTLMTIASRVMAAGADFWLLGAEHTMLRADVPVVSVCAVRTGCGKSPVSRAVARELRQLGWKPVAVRHPMPYGDIARQAVQRFATLADLEKHQCTIEEREEYEPHIAKGGVIYAGVDYEAILRQAGRECDLLLWDGGNNDTPFYKSDLEIVVVDPHRPGHELTYYPGMVNLLRADVIVINKVDTAKKENLDIVRANVRKYNPKARVIEAACRVSVPEPELVKGKRVLVVEDGPTLTHGEMPYGAGVVCARQLGAAELVDPRPFAVGSIRATYEKYSHMVHLLPAMGYSETQRHELEETINRVPCDLVLVATPIDLARVVNLRKPALRVSYEVEALTRPDFHDVLAEFTAAHKRTPEPVEVGR
ncbi:MAG: cyclic 2,3-diphosphoglycerate synthase [Terriglobales bacterium]